MADIDDKTLDKIDARAEQAMAVAVDEGWFDDESALDTYAPKTAHWAYSEEIGRDPREVADAFYIASCDPAIVRGMIAEIRRRCAADLSEQDKAALRHLRRLHVDCEDSSALGRRAIAVLDRLIGDDRG